MRATIVILACGLLACGQLAVEAAQCSYSLSPTSASIDGSGGPGSFNVTVGNSCNWTATTASSWLHTSSTGTGNGTVNYTVDPNAGSSRSGSFTVGTQSFTVNQAGTPLSLGVALDNTNLVWVTSTNYPWYSTNP